MFVISGEKQSLDEKEKKKSYGQCLNKSYVMKIAELYIEKLTVVGVDEPFYHGNCMSTHLLPLNQGTERKSV